MVKKIGKYEVGKTIGTGFGSKVKLGTDTESGDVVALKFAEKKESFRDPTSSENHLWKLMRLQHPCLVRIRELLQTDRWYIVVMDYLPGGELFDKIIEAKRFDEATARTYFQQLVAGVHYCHLNGVTNRDLKPENLLLDEHGRLKITDTAMSWMALDSYLGRPPFLSAVSGVPAYTSPEVLKEPQPDWFKADVWSCGVILYVMLAGYLPFDSPNMNEMFNRLERGDYRMPRMMPPSVADLIQTMLVVDPRQRASLEDVMHHPWFAEGFDPALIGHEDSPRMIDGEPPSIPLFVVEKKSCVERMDAMQLMSHRTACHLAPLTTSNDAPAVLAANSFLFRGTARDLVAELVAMKSNPRLREDSNEIKGFTNMGSQLMTYRAEVVPTTAEGMAFARIELRRGDPAKFAEFVRELQVRAREPSSVDET